MKVLKYILAVVVLVAVGVYAWLSYKQTPVEPMDCYDLAAVIAADFELAKAEAKEGETVQFYEAETILNGAPTNDAVKVVAVMTVFQMKDRCAMIQHAEGAYTNAPKVVVADPGHWLGDFEIPTDPAPVSFDQAVEKLKAWDGIIPDSNKMTLRRPASMSHGHAWDNGQYIFGTLKAGGFVAVDSVTGAIEELEDGKMTGDLQEPVPVE